MTTKLGFHTTCFLLTLVVLLLSFLPPPIFAFTSHTRRVLLPSSHVKSSLSSYQLREEKSHGHFSFFSNCKSKERSFSSFSTSPSSSSSSRLKSSRRDLFHQSIPAILSSILILHSSEDALAASASGSSSSASAKKGPTPEELNRIRVGYDGITYLLDNFDKETTICRENGGECKRDADAVRRYLGLRSTTDPLFQIEKVFDKVKYMDSIDYDEIEKFFEATEEWNTAVNMSNSMAFISQFGEYNPGGGQDEVRKYLEESRKQVLLAQKALKDIIDVLRL